MVKRPSGSISEGTHTKPQQCPFTGVHRSLFHEDYSLKMIGHGWLYKIMTGPLYIKTTYTIWLHETPMEVLGYTGYVLNSLEILLNVLFVVWRAHKAVPKLQSILLFVVRIPKFQSMVLYEVWRRHKPIPKLQSIVLVFVV